MKFSFHLTLTCIVSMHYALAISVSSQKCNAFTKSGITGNSSVTLINSTLVAEKSLNISNTFNDFPFCRVIAKIAYGDNNTDTLNFEVWLPEPEDYNGRFMAVGGGGMAGIIDTRSMMGQLNTGFAVAGGDSGHLASLNNNGGGAPNTNIPYLHSKSQVQAWIHNAIALFTPSSKSLVNSYYGTEAAYSYYTGCSTGGAQAFALAQFWPDLFDGIVAGSPGNWYSHLALSFLWNAQKTEGESYMPQATLDFITSEVLLACDSLDGVNDNLIENPLLCNFNMTTLVCGATNLTNSTTCLTPSQLAAAEAIYAGPKSSNGTLIYPGFSYGSETEWLVEEGALADAFAIPILQNLVYDDLNYNSSIFSFDTDVIDVDEKAGSQIDEISADFTSFRNRGSKFLVTQGWADPFNAATWPIIHKSQIEAFIAADTNSMKTDISDFFNLFMIPGGGHCGAGTGTMYEGVPAIYHTVSALMKWVEKGEKPAEVLSTNPPNKSGRTRKLCPWPQTAKYVSGDVDCWGSYVCEY